MLSRGLVGVEGSHGSVHTLVSLPEPIDFLRPALSSGFAVIRFLQTYDGELTLSTIMGLEFLK